MKLDEHAKMIAEIILNFIAMKKIHIIFLFVPFLQACSFVTDFYVVNNSEESILVEIKLMDKTDGFLIFDNCSSAQIAWQTDKDNKQDWEHYINIDADSLSTSHYTVALPPHRALLIGRMHNEEYSKGKRQFINGRVFNLEYITLTRAGKILKITPDNFDDYFKRKKKEFDVYCVF